MYSNGPSPGALAAYYDSHNAYVQQLCATNAMMDQYHKYTLPTILQRYVVRRRHGDEECYCEIAFPELFPEQEITIVGVPACSNF
ncbi:hypothetical protein EVAR_11419_1 [Eumeta japonica]|uniref:Uncharacterized protein n=1 Tax=Eumeta variegata TaxID=151549 RepID=A0A4C1TNC8_EUMVA|nr:hypothetical protein EVAR_11419_1 [Eumeta japonica]